MSKFQIKLKLLGITTVTLVVVAICTYLIPSKVDGIYYAGSYVQSLDDSKHFIRISDGMVSIYSTGTQNEAYVAGSYNYKSELPLNISSLPDKPFNTPKTLFNITHASLAGARISGESNQFLIRSLPWSPIHRAIKNLEIERIHADKNHIFRDYLNTDYELIRREKLPLPNKTLHPIPSPSRSEPFPISKH